MIRKRQMAEGVCVCMLVSRFITNGVVVSTKGESPPLKACRCHSGNSLFLSQQILKGFVVGQD